MNPERVIPVVVVLVGIGAATWFFWPSSPPPPPPPPVKAEPAAPAGPKFPVAQKPSEPLPALKDSDVTVLEALKGLFGADNVPQLFIPESLIRNFVATVDNLTREKASRRVWPLTAPGGTLKATGKDDKLAIAPDNAARYKRWVDAFDKSDAAAVTGAYVHFYPLFQQAYVELGYPNGYFNDRLVEVIDHLLDAPEPKGPVKLVVPKVLYEYADPDLESRSAGQKILMRIGPDNEARVKAKLREYRKEIVAQTAAASK
ncbi:MAG TPA: DUF3014 domain-containing protein [Usitatibacter sp.]|nr:DUF3014 domain-containing protein [Usitatibacter sp.]